MTSTLLEVSTATFVAPRNWTAEAPADEVGALGVESVDIDDVIDRILSEAIHAISPEGTTMAVSTDEPPAVVVDAPEIPTASVQQVHPTSDPLASSVSPFRAAFPSYRNFVVAGTFSALNTDAFRLAFPRYRNPLVGYFHALRAETLGSAFPRYRNVFGGLTFSAMSAEAFSVPLSSYRKIFSASTFNSPGSTAFRSTFPRYRAILGADAVSALNAEAFSVGIGSRAAAAVTGDAGPAPHPAARYPHLARALQEGRITGEHKPDPTSRTLRLVEEGDALAEEDQVGFGRVGDAPRDQVRRPPRG